MVFVFFLFLLKEKEGRKRNSPTNKNWPKNRNRRGSCIKRDNGHRIEDENKPEVVRERERERWRAEIEFEGAKKPRNSRLIYLRSCLKKALSLSLKTREVCCEVRNDTASFWENIGSGCGWGRVAFAFYFCACKRKTWNLRLWHFRIFLFFFKKN